MYLQKMAESKVYSVVMIKTRTESLKDTNSYNSTQKQRETKSTEYMTT